jgi:hypothetical protein
VSSVSIRAALEAALAAMSPALTTEYQNDPPLVPTAGAAYQRADLLLATPTNNEISRSYVAHGFLQVTLCYPTQAGTGAAEARAELIRSTFYRGRSLTPVGGVTVTIHLTPEILPAYVDGDRFCIPVRVPFRAPVTV